MLRTGHHYVLHLEVSHGADRYDIHLTKDRPLTVRDLMEEIERKSRVTISNQQLIFRGQRLHEYLDETLQRFGVFNGNQIMLIGKKLPAQQDEHFRRLLTMEKDLKSIDEILETICQNFEQMKRSGEPRVKLEPYLYDLKLGIDRSRSNLQTLGSSLNEMNGQPLTIDAQRKQKELLNFVHDRLNISANILSAVNEFKTD